jgi:hypothetical protein
MRDSDRLPEGEVTIAYEMHTPPERGVPAELKFWISGKNSHSKAGSIWLSHKNGLNRSVWYLAITSEQAIPLKYTDTITSKMVSCPPLIAIDSQPIAPSRKNRLWPKMLADCRKSTLHANHR